MTTETQRPMGALLRPAAVLFSVLAVLTSAGAVESGENGQRIAALLLNELK